MLVLDLGGQYAQLIARRVREARGYSELVGHGVTAEQVRARAPHALILSGGPASVYAENAPRIDPGLFDLGVPTLGICYGAQLMALDLGGKVERTNVSEFGKTSMTAVESQLFKGLGHVLGPLGRHNVSEHPILTTDRRLSQQSSTTVQSGSHADMVLRIL